jgi:hypothetical protein
VQKAIFQQSQNSREKFYFQKTVQFIQKRYKDFGHIFPDKLTLKFLGDHSLTPCIVCLNSKFPPVVELCWQNNSYLRYKCKKLSFIARTGLKYDRGTREYFKECECNKGTFYTYVLQHFIYDHNLLLLVIILFVIF